MRYLYSVPVFGQSVLNSTCKFPPFSLPPEKKGKPSKDLCTIDCNHETFCWRFQTYRITGESWASERDRKGWNLLWFNIYASSANFIPTYPGGRTRTAALVPEVRMRRIGWPVTRLFQEYGSATSKPGVGGIGFSSTWAASLGSAKNREQKQSTW